MDLLEPLTERRETGYKPERPDGRDALGEVQGERGAFRPSPSATLSLHLHMFTNPEAL